MTDKSITNANQESNVLISKDGATSCSIDDKTKKSTKPKASKAKKKTGKGGTKSTSKTKSNKKADTSAHEVEAENAKLKKQIEELIELTIKKDKDIDRLGAAKLTEEEKEAKRQEKAEARAEKEAEKEAKRQEKAAAKAKKEFEALQKAAKREKQFVIDVDDYYEAIEQVVENFNKEHYHIYIEGKNFVCKFVEKRRKNNEVSVEIDVTTFEEFHKLYCHLPKITDPKTQETFKQTQIWLESENKRWCKKGFVFDPADEPLSLKNGCLNLFRGFAVPVSEMSIEELEQDEQIQMYKEFIHEVICDNNGEHAKYLTQYLAQLIQQPAIKPSISVVMKAGQGVGKGTLMDSLKTIWGSHGIAVASSRYITSRFNVLLECKVFIFFDEAFASSKEASDMMKGYISEDYLTIERKQINPYQVDNYVRFFLASNSENIVNIENDDRRYFYLAVSEKYKQKSPYFTERNFMRKSKGKQHREFCSKLLKYLLHFDISDFNLHKAPETAELRKKKLDHLPIVPSFVAHMLTNGRNDQRLTYWTDTVLVSDIQDFFNRWLFENNKKLLGLDLNRALGIALGKINALRSGSGGSAYKRKYVFPPLAVAIENFEIAYNLKLDAWVEEVPDAEEQVSKEPTTEQQVSKKPVEKQQVSEELTAEEIDDFVF